MAFLTQDPNQQDPNQQQQQQGQPQQSGIVTGQGVTIGGASQQNPNGPTTGGGTSTGTSPASGSPKGTSSGSFTNLQNYVTANQGNDSQMGQAITNTVQGAANQADQVGSQYQSGAQQQIGAQTVNEDPSLINNLNSGNAGAVDKTALGNEWNAKYGGPTDATGFNGYGNAQQAYKNVDTYGQEAAGDSAARQQLLQDTYGKAGHQYNQGESTLDSFILGTGQGGAQALNNINHQYGNYSQNFQNIAQAINQGVQKAQQTDQQTAQDVQNAAKTGFGMLQGHLDQAADQANTANVGAANLNNRLVAGDVASLKEQGLSDADIKYLQQQGGKNYNWANLVNQRTGRYTAGDFADKNDINNYQNLLSLVNGVAPGSLAAKYGSDQLANSGAGGPTLKGADIQAVNDLVSLNANLNRARASKQYEDAQQYADLQRDLGGFGMSGMSSASPGQVAALAKTLGVNPKDLMTVANGAFMGNDLKAAGLDPNGNLSQLLRTPGQFTLGDVASNAQRDQFANLSNLLGLNPNQGMSRSGNQAINFNRDAFNALLQKRNAELAQTAAANAEANANGGTDPGNTGDNQPWYNINKYVSL